MKKWRDKRAQQTPRPSSCFSPNEYDDNHDVIIITIIVIHNITMIITKALTKDDRADDSRNDIINILQTSDVIADGCCANATNTAMLVSSDAVFQVTQEQIEMNETIKLSEIQTCQAVFKHGHKNHKGKTSCKEETSSMHEGEKKNEELKYL